MALLSATCSKLDSNALCGPKRRFVDLKDNSTNLVDYALVYWPGGAPPTKGRHSHDLEAVEFFKTFPDNHLINRPYKILLASGNHTCSVADFSGTMKGPMKTADGKVIPPTGKSFRVEFCTVATWNDKGEITEERLFYDQVGLMKQIGLMET